MFLRPALVAPPVVGRQLSGGGAGGGAERADCPAGHDSGAQPHQPRPGSRLQLAGPPSGAVRTTQ